MNLPLNEPHRHLGEDALWEMAEARVAGQVMGQAAELAQAIAAAQACPECAPRLQAATRQIAALRALPEVKAPPDFLLLVQNRIEAENTFWKRSLATLRGWVMPGRTGGAPTWAPGGVPLGFASAALVVIVLIVALPRQEKVSEAPAGLPAETPASVTPSVGLVAPEAPKPVKSEEKLVMEKPQVTEKKQAMDEERVTFELPKGVSPSKAKSPSAKPTAEISVARASRAESSPPAEAAPASAPAAPTTALAAMNEVKAMARSKSAALADRDAESQIGAQDSREVFTQRVAKLLAAPAKRHGDTLVFAGDKHHAEDLRRLVDSLGLAPKAHFDLRGDSVFLQLRP